LVLGSSNFLARLLLRRPEWVAELAGAPPDPPRETPGADWGEIREVKYRGLLRIAARDLHGRPFEESLQELSELADRCLRAGLDCAAREADLSAPALFALGKLGGRELNFSSDVDLLVIYETPPERDGLAHNDDVARLVRQLKAGLEQPSEMGFVYRVDLDLRPEGPTGALANSVDAALSYYENFGAEWERQALLRLRYVAGPPETAQRFEQGVAPFVYRRTIGLDVLGAVRAMKSRIEADRRKAGKDLEADLKEGPGGIRDVEFLVQALQLLYGGREIELRTGNVLRALEGLVRIQALSEDTVSTLRSAYLWLRRAEHALQLTEERRTQQVPRAAAGRLALARRMGYADAEGERARSRWQQDWSTFRSEVRESFEALVLEAEV
jgi:glutamate-ammonia-ligase adenylyltransferase